jgi:hypothetical protein
MGHTPRLKRALSLPPDNSRSQDSMTCESLEWTGRLNSDLGDMVMDRQGSIWRKYRCQFS